jgi:hypothetical protein
MGLVIFLPIIILILTLMETPDDIYNKKSIIITTEILILYPLFIFMGVYLSRLYWDDKISSSFVWFITISFPSTIIYLFRLYNKKRFNEIDNEIEIINQRHIEKYNKIEEDIRIKKEMYMTSLQNGDKVKALQLGRLYYSSIGVYDEQRIQNDLLCFLKLK